MLARLRLLVAIVSALVIMTLGIDWLVSRARLRDVVIEGYLDPPQVVADGRQSTVVRVRVTEKGRPRVGDLIQAFLQSGNGLLIPEWVHTDANGEARISYTPNPLTPYDLQEDTVIHLLDISIGRLVEVDCHYTIQVPVVPATSQ